MIPNINSLYWSVHKLLKKRYPQLHKIKNWLKKVTLYNLQETIKQFKKLEKKLENPESDYHIMMIMWETATTMEEKAALITDHVATIHQKVVWKPEYHMLDYYEDFSWKQYYHQLQTIRLQEQWWWYFTCPFKKHIYIFVLRKLKELHKRKQA